MSVCIYYITKLLIITQHAYITNFDASCKKLEHFFSLSLSLFFSLFISHVHFIKKYATFLPSDVNLVVYIFLVFVSLVIFLFVCFVLFLFLYYRIPLITPLKT